MENSVNSVSEFVGVGSASFSTAYAIVISFAGAPRLSCFSNLVSARIIGGQLTAGIAFALYISTAYIRTSGECGFGLWVAESLCPAAVLLVTRVHWRYLFALLLSTSAFLGTRSVLQVV